MTTTMKQTLYYLNDDDTWFPPVNDALEDPSGLLAVGGDLSSTRLINAYEQGIFPWYSDQEPLLWWSPDPRAVIDVGEVRVNKSLRKFLKKCPYKVSINRCFEQVITQCSLPRSEENGTWIFPEMKTAYVALHQQHKAHSIEIWSGESGSQTLVGGLYGVQVGSSFCGESMFSAQPNASKLALLVLESLLAKYQHSFIDCQLPNPYLISMGAKTIDRDLFLDRLQMAAIEEINPDDFEPRNVDWRALLHKVIGEHELL